MATKVFYRCVETFTDGWIVGKEYECGASSGGIKSEYGYFLHYRKADELCAYNSTSKAVHFQRIERDCFEHGGKTWFRHTPGDPMPCEENSEVCVIHANGIYAESSYPAWCFGLNWMDCASEIVGWRYADPASAPASPTDWTEYPHSTTGLTFQPKIDGAANIPAVDPREFKGFDDLPGPRMPVEGERYFISGDGKMFYDFPPDGPSLPETYEKTWPSTERFRNFAWLEFLQRAALDVAAVEDTSLPPRIRRIVNEKEEAHAAKQQLAKDAQAKALQERADQLADAGRAMDRVNQDHSHKLGWRQ